MLLQTSRIISLENDILEMKLRVEKVAKELTSASDKIRELERIKLTLSDENASLKGNMQSISKDYQSVVCR